MSLSISVITPVYNREKTIQRSIRSVQAQSYSCQHIIVDGLSTDKTVSLIKKSLRKNDIFISEPDNGIYDAINKGIDLASGDVIAILNSDDYYLNGDVLKLVSNHFSKKTELVYAGTRYFTREETNYVDYLPYEYNGFGSFVSGWHPPHPSFFALKRCYEEGGFYNTDLKVAADFELMLRFFETCNFHSRRLNKILVGMSSGGYSSKWSSILRGASEIKESFRKNSQEAPKLYFVKRYGKKLVERKLSLWR